MMSNLSFKTDWLKKPDFVNDGQTTGFLQVRPSSLYNARHLAHTSGIHWDACAR